jgi:transcriptional regulator with XRE-family HTH domain
VSKENTFDCLGAVIKTARQAKGLTQTQLAETLRITARHLKAIENSGQKPSYDLFVRIVRELDISADTVFYPDGQKNSVKIFKLWGGRKPG